MLPSPLQNDIRTSADLATHYRQYLRVLNNRTFDLMSRFVARRCIHNGHRLSNAEYSNLIKPGATFCADEIVADVAQRTLAARLHIEFPTPATPVLTSAIPSSPDRRRRERSREASPNLNAHAHTHAHIHAHTHTPVNAHNQNGGTERSPTRTPKITRINEHVFYHFDDNWCIDRVWSMLEDVSDRPSDRNTLAVASDFCECLAVEGGVVRGSDMEERAPAWQEAWNVVGGSGGRAGHSGQASSGGLSPPTCRQPPMGAHRWPVRLPYPSCQCGGGER